MGYRSDKIINWDLNEQIIEDNGLVLLREQLFKQRTSVKAYLINFDLIFFKHPLGIRCFAPIKL